MASAGRFVGTASALFLAASASAPGALAARGEGRPFDGLEDPHGTRDLVRRGGTDPDARDGLGRTLLHHVAWKGRAKDVRALVRAGFDVNARNHAGAAPLHDAAERGDPGVVRALLRRGAQVNARKTRTGELPIHHAARNPDGRVVRLLVGAGSPVNAVDAGGRAPIRHAVRWGGGDAVHALLRAGAAPDVPDIPDAEGGPLRTLLDEAAVLERPEAVLALEAELERRKLAGLLRDVCGSPRRRRR